MLYLKADTITEVTVGPAVALGDGFTPVTNLVGSTADEFELIKHGATTTTTVAGTLAPITGADGYYALDLSATDTNTEGRLVLLINDDSLILPLRHEFMVVNANVYDSLFAAATTDYLQVDTLQINGTTQTANDNGADINTLISNQGDWATATGFATPTNITAASGITLTPTTGLGTQSGTVANVTTVGSVTTKTGYSLAATTGLGNQTANIAGSITTVTGNVDGSVASVTGQVTADVTALNGDATAAANLEILFDGNEGFYSAYSGPRGPGVYLNDAAANTNTTNGVDGTIGKPVSTIAAAKTMADSMSLDRIYLINDSAILLPATMTDYEFVGIGGPAGNTVALESRDVSGSSFYNVTVAGVQGGSGRAHYEDVIFGTCTLHAHALRCGFSDETTGITFSNNDDNLFDQCYSMVPGNGAPKLLCNNPNLDLSIRHYSGGVEIASSSATATMSIETDGQVVFGAACNTSTAVTIRGNCTITDNTAGMSALTIGAVYNTTAINTEMVDVLFTDTDAEPAKGAPGATISLAEKIGYLYKAWRNKSTQSATTYSLYDSAGTTIDHDATVSDDTTTAEKGVMTDGP